MLRSFFYFLFGKKELDNQFKLRKLELKNQIKNLEFDLRDKYLELEKNLNDKYLKKEQQLLEKIEEFEKKINPDWYKHNKEERNGNRTKEAENPEKERVLLLCLIKNRANTKKILIIPFK